MSPVSSKRTFAARVQRRQIDDVALAGNGFPHSQQRNRARPLRSMVGQSPASCPQHGKSSQRAIRRSSLGNNFDTNSPARFPHLDPFLHRRLTPPLVFTRSRLLRGVCGRVVERIQEPVTAVRIEGRKGFHDRRPIRETDLGIAAAMTHKETGKRKAHDSVMVAM